MSSTKLLSLGLIVALLALTALSACGPTPTNIADPQVKGDHSTISGDAGATRELQTRRAAPPA
jgi:hypothetical protein